MSARRFLRRLRVALLPAPGQAVVLALLALVLGAALVSAPLVLASAEEGTWEQEQARRSAADLGVTIISSTLPMTGASSRGRIAQAGRLDEAVAETTEQTGLGTPERMVRLRDSLRVDLPGPVDLRSQLMHLTGWEDNIRLVEGEITDDGIVIPSRLAERAGIGPGGELSVLDVDGELVGLPVTGVYAEIEEPVTGFWAPQAYLFQPIRASVTGDPDEPPPLSLARQGAVIDVATEIGYDLLLEWTVPLPPGTDVDAARTAVRRSQDLQVQLVSPSRDVASIVTNAQLDRPVVRTELPTVLADVDRTVDLLGPPVRAVGTGAALAALVLVGAWAGQRVRQRHGELESLVVRGMSPAGGALRAAREALLPLVVGVIAGAAVGWALVRAVGPSSRFPDGTADGVLVPLAVGAGAALLLVVVVTAALVARLDQLGSGALSRSLGRIPWLAVTAAVAVVTAVPVVKGEADGVGALVLALPLLVTIAVAGAVAAVLPRIARLAAPRLGPLPAGAFLALRRILSARGAARLVVVTTALSAGLVVYAGALGESASRTVSAKAAVVSGGETVVPLVRRTREPGPLPEGAALVGTERGVQMVPGDFEAEMLALDPDDAMDVIRWDDALADAPVEDLLRSLADHDGDRVPALLTGPLPDGVDVGVGTEMTLDFNSYYSLPLEVVGRAAAFPGQTGRGPMMVVRWVDVTAALESVDRDPRNVFEQQVWAPTGERALLPALAASGYAFDVGEVRTADDFAAQPEVRAQAVSLDYLRAVALGAGLLGLLGVALHALAQQRRRTVAALLLARMGLSRGAADRSAALETGLLAALGAFVAVAVALPTSALVVRLLDPAPALLPGVLFTVPRNAIAAVLAGAAVVTVVVGLLVARAARRSSAGEVLRDAG